MILALKQQLTTGFKGIEKRFSTVIPYIWGLLSACFITAANLFVKRLSKDFPTTQILFFRSLELALFTYGFMVTQKLEFHYKNITINRLLIARAFAGTMGIGMAYYGVRLLPLSDASVIMQVYPVITGVLATLVLGEKYERSQLVAAIVCLAGVTMIAQPPAIFGEESNSSDGHNRVFGTVILLIGGLSASVVDVLVKKVGSKTNMGVPTFVFGIIAALLSGVLSLWNGFAAIRLHHVLPLFWIGFLSFVGQMLKNRAFLLGNTGRVSNTSYAGIIVSFFLDIFVLGTDVNGWSMCGGLCILSCMFIYIYQLYMKEKSALKQVLV